MPTNSGLSTWPGSGRQQWRPHHCWLLGPSLLGVCLVVKWLCFSVGFLNALFCLLIPFLVLCLSPQIHTVFTYMQAFISVGYAISFNSKNLCICIAPQACIKATFFFLLKKKMFIWKRERQSFHPLVHSLKEHSRPGWCQELLPSRSLKHFRLSSIESPRCISWGAGSEGEQLNQKLVSTSHAMLQASTHYVTAAAPKLWSLTQSRVPGDQQKC